MTRNKSISALRSEIPTIKIMDDMTRIERFQNEVIRPILKYQHDLILQYINTKALDRNSKFDNLLAIEKINHLDKVILKDNKVKQELIGIVLGLLTVEEMKTYLALESECKRRINTMIKERIISTL